MIPCHACNRHISTSESSCPFCGAAFHTSSDPSARKLMGVALAFGLALAGCDGDDGDSDDMTTNESNDGTMETGTDSTNEEADQGGDEYGGAPPPPEWDQEVFEVDKGTEKD